MNARALDATHLTELVPPASIAEARTGREALARLLDRERAAAADFLLALADFDRRRGWEALGHASLFAFLTRELGLSKGGAFFRLTAARLLVRCPEVLAPLRDGRLCITSVVELARVVTPENQAEVLPRFFGCSSREAREVAAALAPRADPPRREVVTLVQPMPQASHLTLAAPTTVAVVQSTEPRAVAPTLDLAPPPAREIEPLSADLRRLHLTVSTRLLDKVAAARRGLGHALPGATTEQVLEVALDLLLERQARRRSQVRRPRSAASPAVPAASSPASPPALGLAGTAATPVRHVPAAVEREVRLRDGDRCQFPLDAGSVCGSVDRVQLDHIHPLALGGPTTAANLRCTCARHNRRAAELALGPAVAETRRRWGPRRRRG